MAKGARRATGGVAKVSRQVSSSSGAATGAPAANAGGKPNPGTKPDKRLKKNQY